MANARHLRALPGRVIRAIWGAPAPSAEVEHTFAEIRLLEVVRDAGASTIPIPDTVVLNGIPCFTSATRPVQVHYDEEGFTEVTVTFIPSSLEIRTVPSL